MESITSVIFMYRGGMFSCSLKNGTTMEYRTLDSLLIRCWPGRHSLSGESPEKRQDFVFRCRSESRPLFAGKLAAAWPSCVAHLGDLRIPLELHFAHGESARRDLEQQAIRAALELARIIHQTRNRLAGRN